MSAIGEEITKTNTFTALGTSTPTDPTAVYVIHRKPDLSETIYEYLTDPEITRSSDGVYVFTIILTDARRHYFRWVGTGDVDDSAEQFEDVTESYFLDPDPTD